MSNAPAIKDTPLEVIRVEKTFALGSCGRVQLSCWHQRIVAADVQSMHSSSRRLLARLGGEKMASLSIVDTTVALPDEATRKLSADLMQKIATQQVASATIVEGDGFKASAARAVFTGMILMSRSSMPQKPFGNVDDAVSWLATFIALSADGRAALASAARELRRRQMALWG